MSKRIKIKIKAAGPTDGVLLNAGLKKGEALARKLPGKVGKFVNGLADLLGVEVIPEDSVEYTEVKK